MPHMTRRVATRKRLILASGIQKRIREPRSEVERAGSQVGWFERGRIVIPFYADFRPLFRQVGRQPAGIPC